MEGEKEMNNEELQEKIKELGMTSKEFLEYVGIKEHKVYQKRLLIAIEVVADLLIKNRNLKRALENLK